jgi:hypothetical protein
VGPKPGPAFHPAALAIAAPTRIQCEAKDAWSCTSWCLVKHDVPCEVRSHQALGALSPQRASFCHSDVTIPPSRLETGRDFS